MLYESISAGALLPPKPRISGAMTWKPAAAIAGIWCRQEKDNSGQPWQSSTSGPSPCSRTKISIPLAEIVREDGMVFRLVCEISLSQQHWARTHDLPSRDDGEKPCALTLD